MNIELIVTDGEQYANDLGKKVDWDKTENTDMISYKEYDTLNKILSCEVFVMRRTGVDGLQIDTMTEIRRSLINEYEETFNKEYNYPNQEVDF